MDFELNEEQRSLQKSAANFLKKECPKDLVRRLDDSETGHSPELWHKMAELGWMGILLPEQYGGIGWSFLHYAVLMEEMGFNICPGPFISTTILGSLPLLMAGSDEHKSEYLPRVASGDLILTMAVTEADGGYGSSSLKMRATEEGDHWILNGVKLFVPDAVTADYILCVSRTEEDGDPENGIFIFLVKKDVPGLKVTPLKTISRDRLCEVAFENVRLGPECMVGSRDHAFQLIKDTLNIAALARSAELIGFMRATLNMAVAYAKERVQFGKPIGSYQAIQHYLTDMWLDLLGTRNLVLKAAWKLSKDHSAQTEISMAKAMTGKLTRKTTTVAHRIFGAIGFAMEHDLHLYHRRALGGDLAFGDTAFHYEEVAKSIGL